MNVIDLLDVMAKGLETFYGRLSYEMTLIMMSAFIGSIFLVLAVHILLGSKAISTMRANGVARYFENYYMGSYLDARRFMYSRWYLLTRKSKKAFLSFITSDADIKCSGFLNAVSSRGKNSLGLVGDIFAVGMVIAEAFVLLKAYVSELESLELIIFGALPIVAMFVLKVLLYGLVSIVNKRYSRSVERLHASARLVHFNNEEKHASEQRAIKADADYLRPSGCTLSSAEQIIRDMQSGENTLDGDSQVDALGSMSDNILSSADKDKYDAFVARLQDDVL